MRHPLSRLTPDAQRRVFLPLLIATLLMTLLFRFIGPAQPNIVDYELAGSVSRATDIIHAWNENDRIRAGFNLGIDYLYMPLYSTTIALACVWGAGVLKRKTWHTIGLLLAWSLWAAAIFDAIENLGLVVSLFGAPVAPWPVVSQVCAILKFTLLVLGLLYVIVSLARRVFKL